MATIKGTLGKYQLHEELGHGGFATVYRAHDPDLGMDVALKVLSTNLMRDPAFVERFRNEARVSARLKHPNIASVYNIDQADGHMFIAIEYVPGRNLHDRLKDQPLLDWPLVTSIVRQVGEALDYAHAQRILHRDVKPNNIIVTDEGQAVLTDFGLAKAAEGSGLTTSGVTLGTFKYIAPEQANGKDVDARSDLYSLAVVAYELCTGRAPFDSDSTPALLHAQVYDAPPAPSQVNARVAAPIETVLLKGLSKEREARYQSGKELAAALSAAVDQARGTYLERLYQEAQSAAQGGDFDAAEAKLQEALSIDGHHIAAQQLLTEIQRIRDWQQRYARLSEQVASARAEAQRLKQAAPGLADPEGLFDVWNRAPQNPIAISPKLEMEMSSLQQPTRRVMPVIDAMLIVGVIATAAGVLLMALAKVSPSFIGSAYTYLYTYEIADLRYGGMLLGAGLVLLLTSVIRFVKARRKPVV